LDFIIDQNHVERVIDSLLNYVLYKFDDWAVFRLPDTVPELCNVKFLLQNPKQGFKTEIIMGDSCPYQLLPKDYDSFLAKLGRRRRESIRRKFRKVKKQFEIRLETIHLSEFVDHAFSNIFNIYTKSLRGKQSNRGFANSDYFKFHKEIAQLFAEHRWLRIYILWFDEVPVAYIYGYLYNNVFWYYQTAFDLEYQKYGPGSIALQMTIESVINEGAKEFDFLRGDEAYKFHFAENIRQQKKILIFRNKGLSYSLFKLYQTGSKTFKNFKNFTVGN
jgi:hypothetical protein